MEKVQNNKKEAFSDSGMSSRRTKTVNVEKKLRNDMKFK